MISSLFLRIARWFLIWAESRCGTWCESSSCTVPSQLRILFSSCSRCGQLVARCGSPPPSSSFFPLEIWQRRCRQWSSTSWSSPPYSCIPLWHSLHWSGILQKFNSFGWLPPPNIGRPSVRCILCQSPRFGRTRPRWRRSTPTQVRTRPPVCETWPLVFSLILALLPNRRISWARAAPRGQWPRRPWSGALRRWRQRTGSPGRSLPYLAWRPCRSGWIALGRSQR